MVDSVYVVVIGMIVFFVLFGLFVVNVKKKGAASKSISLVGFCLLTLLLTFATASSADKEADKRYLSEQAAVDSSEFYELDKIMDKSEIGSRLMTSKDYDAFAEGGLLLEGVIFKFGAPSHSTSTEKGDTNMEVTYPTNETGISIGLKFEYKPSGLGDWKLKEKYVVKTDGIGFDEYNFK